VHKLKNELDRMPKYRLLAYTLRNEGLFEQNF